MMLPLKVPIAPASPLRILLVDDHATVRIALSTLLRHLCHDVDVVADGPAVLEATARHPYELILMDIQMPVMDGLETTRRLRRRRPPGSGPRIVALTADATAEDRARYIDAGMDDALAKPVRLQDLVTLLDHWLPSSQSRDLP